MSKPKAGVAPSVHSVDQIPESDPARKMWYRVIPIISYSIIGTWLFMEGLSLLKGLELGSSLTALRSAAMLVLGFWFNEKKEDKR